MAQLWLRDLTSEYAMNKPPEEEIWPDTKVTERDPFKTFIDCENGWIMVHVDQEGEEFDFPDDNIETKYTEKHRTHCPKCWEKYEAWAFLGEEMAGHEAWFCKADDDLYSQFPREG